MEKVTASDGRPVSLGAVMTGGAYTMQRAREKDDFYPTPPEATEALMRYLPIKTGCIWENCAGNGMLADVVKKHHPARKMFMTDINPRREDIVQMDFLRAEHAPEDPDDITIITNPPFKLAEKFIRHGFALGVGRQAILLKSTYFHASTRTPMFRQFKPAFVLPLNWRLDFMNLGRPVMECSWFVFDGPGFRETVYDVLERP